MLCVHDSFIIDYRLTKTMKFLMALASRRVVGSVLPISYDWMGWDELPEERRDSYADVRRIEPTRGSLERRALFEKAFGPIAEG